MSVDLENLPDSPEELKELVINLVNIQIKQRDSLIKQNESRILILNDLIKSLKHQLFGRRSEKLTPEEYQQTRLFNEAEETILAAQKSQEKIHIKSYDRKKPGGRRPFPEELPREEIMIDIPEEEKLCDCGHTLKKIGEETTEKADIVPAKIVIRKYVRPKYACPHCKGDDVDGAVIKIAPMPAEMLPKSRVSSGFLAWSLNSKFSHHLPFYRQEQILRSLGVDIDRDDLSRYTIKIGKILEEKILPLMWSDLLRSPVIGADETPFDLLIRPDANKKKVKQVYMNVYHGSDPPMILFKYQSTRRIEFLRELLHEYTGIVMTDDYGGYNWLHMAGSKITHVNCMAHVRRKFFDAVLKDKNSRAAEGLNIIRELYLVEKIARENNFSADKIRTLRQEKSVPLMNRLHQYLLKSQDEAYPGFPFERAVSYALKLWPRLQPFLHDGKIPIDNNAVENAIRPFALGRKNWLFSAAISGAEASAAVYSIIQSAKINGHDPYKYLLVLFEKLPEANSVDEIRALLPYNLTPTTNI